MDLMVGDHVISARRPGGCSALGMQFMALATGKREARIHTPAPIALVSEKFNPRGGARPRERGHDHGRRAYQRRGARRHLHGRPRSWPTRRCARRGRRRGLRGHGRTPTSRRRRSRLGVAGAAAHAEDAVLLMSATLGDVSAIAASLKERTGTDVDVVADAPRPVPPLGSRRVRGDAARNARWSWPAQGEAPPRCTPALLADAALATAQALSSHGVLHEQRVVNKDAVKGTRFTTAFGKTPAPARRAAWRAPLAAGMLPRWCLLVEKLAQQGPARHLRHRLIAKGINVPSNT